MARRRLTLSGALFLGLFQAGPHAAYAVTRDAIPADAVIVDAVYNEREDLVFIWLEHQSWGGVAEEINPELQLLLPSEMSEPVPVRVEPRCRCGRRLIENWCEACTMDASTCDCVAPDDEPIPDGWDDDDVGIEVLRLRGLTADGPAVG